MSRVRSGRGFRYLESDGAPVRDETVLARIRLLAIPPAWTDVWICEHPNGHIQATGLDAEGRRQYIYHAQWSAKRARVKYARALELAATLPSARRRVTTALRSDGLTRERVLAAAFRMLDTGSLRVGSERYAEANGSFGLSTMMCVHATVAGADTVELRFPAKSGQEWESSIRDPDLAVVVKLLKRRGGTHRLLAWSENGQWHPVDAAEINGYVRELTGGDFTAKDFRTLHGSVAAAKSLAKHGPAHTITERKRAIAQAMRDAADELCNTPAIARSSYVDPRIVDLYARGRTIDPTRLASAESELRELLG